MAVYVLKVESHLDGSQRTRTPTADDLRSALRSISDLGGLSLQRPNGEALHVGGSNGWYTASWQEKQDESFHHWRAARLDGPAPELDDAQFAEAFSRPFKLKMEREELLSESEAFSLLSLFRRGRPRPTTFAWTLRSQEKIPPKAKPPAGAAESKMGPAPARRGGPDAHWEMTLDAEHGRYEKTTDPSVEELRIAVEEIEFGGGFIVLHGPDGRFAQTSVQCMFYEVEWQEPVEGKRRHWRAGRADRPVSDDAAAAFERRECSPGVQSHELLTRDDAFTILKAFRQGRRGPKEYAWRDATDEVFPPTPESK